MFANCHVDKVTGFCFVVFNHYIIIIIIIIIINPRANQGNYISCTSWKINQSSRTIIREPNITVSINLSIKVSSAIGLIMASPKCSGSSVPLVWYMRGVGPPSSYVLDNTIGA